MDEKLYKSMGRIAMGIVSIIVGVTVGVLSIVCGGRLLNDKRHLLF